jgi:hypothetical protein
MLALAEIAKQLIVDRDARGKIQRITNMEVINEEWQQWKQTKLTNLFPVEKEQTKFVDNFERGLSQMDKSIPNNLNYFILLPEIYQVKKYLSPSNAGSELLLHSRLVANMPIRCRFVPTHIATEGDTAIIKLEGELQNVQEMQRKHLKMYYKNQSDFSLSDYAFTIDLDYEINLNNGEILRGNLFLKEKMHDHLQYVLNLQAIKTQANHTPSGQQPPAATSRRRFLADEIADE